MRDLKKSDKNIMRIKDTISNSEIELYYRTPLASEIAQYHSMLVKRKGGKIIMNPIQTRLEMGLKILTGFREGDFGYDGKPISSDPQSPYYREDWKELLRDTAADIIIAFAFNIFEGVQPLKEEDLAEVEFEDIPFQKSSTDG